jgi:hypothetical protein
MSLFESTNLIPPLLRIVEEYYGLGFKPKNPYEAGRLGRWASREYVYAEMVLVGALDAGYYKWSFHIASQITQYNSSYIAAGRAGWLGLIKYMRGKLVKNHRVMLEAAACSGHVHILDHFGDSLPKYMARVIGTKKWWIFQKFADRVPKISRMHLETIGETCDDTFIYTNTRFLLPHFPIIAEAAIKSKNMPAVKGLIRSGCSMTDLIRLLVKYDQDEMARWCLDRTIDWKLPLQQSALNSWIIEYNALKCAKFYRPLLRHKEMITKATPEIREILKRKGDYSSDRPVKKRLIDQ